MDLKAKIIVASAVYTLIQFVLGRRLSIGCINNVLYGVGSVQNALQAQAIKQSFDVQMLNGWVLYQS